MWKGVLMSNRCQIKGKWVEGAFAVAWLKHNSARFNPLRLTETQTGSCLQSLEFKLPKTTHIHAGKQLRVWQPLCAEELEIYSYFWDTTEVWPVPPSCPTLSSHLPQVHKAWTCCKASAKPPGDPVPVSARWAVRAHMNYTKTVLALQLLHSREALLSVRQLPQTQRHLNLPLPAATHCWQLQQGSWKTEQTISCPAAVFSYHSNGHSCFSAKDCRFMQVSFTSMGSEMLSWPSWVSVGKPLLPIPPEPCGSGNPEKKIRTQSILPLLSVYIQSKQTESIGKWDQQKSFQF